MTTVGVLATVFGIIGVVVIGVGAYFCYINSTGYCCVICARPDSFGIALLARECLRAIWELDG